MIRAFRKNPPSGANPALSALRPAALPPRNSISSLKASKAVCLAAPHQSRLFRSSSIYRSSTTSSSSSWMPVPSSIRADNQSHIGVYKASHLHSHHNHSYSRRTQSYSSSSSSTTPSKRYDFESVKALISAPSKERILIDVREPHELAESGTIPSAINIPLKSAPDALLLAPEDFELRFGFEKPPLEREVVFFCRSGVRSKAAAEIAKRAGYGLSGSSSPSSSSVSNSSESGDLGEQSQKGGIIGEYEGSWMDWVKHGGEVQR